jgi:HPt (histidine-containing phosphotransfer) domain-containing protein
MDISFLNAKGIDTRTGIEFTGNMEKYISALKRYFNSYEDNRKKILELYEKGDMDNYSIAVHALKSNSKMVGAMALAESFQKLEIASREGGYTYVKENHERVLEAYRDFTELIRPIAEADTAQPADEIGGERAKEIVSDLLEALDDFDDDKSRDLAEKLSGYPFGATEKEKLERAVRHIDSFMYDDAAEIIKEISQTIE